MNQLGTIYDKMRDLPYIGQSVRSDECACQRSQRSAEGGKCLKVGKQKMPDLREDGEQDEKQKRNRRHFLSGAREGASGATKEAEETQQANRLEQEEEEAKP